jgi:acetyl-CoA acetyltransferase
MTSTQNQRARDYSGMAIVGYGETPYQRTREHAPMYYIADSIRRALQHCGLRKDDVDGLSVTSFELPPDHTVTVAEHLGMSIRWGFHGVYGGASAIIGIAQAARAIQAGDAEVVVVVAADAVDVAAHNAEVSAFNRPIRDFVASYGFGGANGIFGLVQRLHSDRYGTTREQLGKLAITQRRHAGLNPNALLRSPLTLEDYLNARVIADPIHLYDCVLPCSGGGALVVTSQERAHSLGRPAVGIRGFGQRHNYDPGEVVVLSQGWRSYAKEMFESAGIGHEEIDMIQLYDDYPIMNLIQLEDLGFCDKGGGGEFIDATDFSITGDLPLNTGGGQLSAGQCGAGGGIIGPVEAVRQLMGESGQRQVAEARTALVSGFGMVAYGRGLSTSAMILDVR